jgi:hypothetical protein
MDKQVDINLGLIYNMTSSMRWHQKVGSTYHLSWLLLDGYIMHNHRPNLGKDLHYRIKDQ